MPTAHTTSPTSSIHYLLGDLFETDANGNILTSYIDGPAGNLASCTGAPTCSDPSYLYYDAHGNLAAEADSSGSLTASHTYDPFGAPTDAVPTDTTTHRFVARWNKQFDTASGLILMGARPYDPKTGRFLAIDPIPGGSLNNYDYAGQDPVNGYDLNGTHHDSGDTCSNLDGKALIQCARNHWTWEAYQYEFGRGKDGGQSLFSQVWGFVKRHWRDCVSGGAIGLAEGPGAALGGCAVGVIASELESSKIKAVHYFGIALSVWGYGRDAITLRALYRRDSEVFARELGLAH